MKNTTSLRYGVAHMVLPIWCCPYGVAPIFDNSELFKSSDISLTCKSHIISKPFPPGGAILVAKVVPESCQRTDGIDSWIEIKTEKDNKRMEKEEKRRDKKERPNL